MQEKKYCAGVKQYRFSTKKKCCVTIARKLRISASFLLCRIKNDIKPWNQMKTNVWRSWMWLIMFLDCFYDVNMNQRLLLIFLYLRQWVILSGKVLQNIVYCVSHRHKKRRRKRKRYVNGNWKVWSYENRFWFTCPSNKQLKVLWKDFHVLF